MKGTTVAVVAACALLLLAAGGCGGQRAAAVADAAGSDVREGDASPSDAAATGDGDAVLPADAPAADGSAADAPAADVPGERECPPGQRATPDGAGCMAVGVQGCAERFVAPDGSCRPSLAACPAGSTPKLDEGCVPVGIPGCAAEFMADDGLCRPTVDACPAGSIPQLAEGCGPVGIPGCAALFLEEDGLCHPSLDKCPAGSIPRFGEGCVPVGIRECAAAFLGADGLCLPTAELCPDGTFPVPSLGCVSEEGPAGCGEGPFGAVAAAPGTLYVDAAAPAGGDGARERPLRSVQAALDRAAAGGRVVLAAGTYEENLLVQRPVEVIGRCAALVRLRGAAPAGDGYATVEVDGVRGVVLSGLGVAGPGPGVLAYGGAELALRDVVVENAAGFGISAEDAGTALTATRALVRATVPLGGAAGFGAQCRGGAALTFAQSALVGNSVLSVVAADAGSALTLTDTLVEGTRPHAGGDGGIAVTVDDGAQADLSGTALGGGTMAGLWVVSAGSTARVQDSVVAGVRPQPSDGQGGIGVLVDGGRLELAGSAVVANEGAGVGAGRTPDVVSIRGSLIARNRPRPDGDGGFGLDVEAGTSLVLEDSLLHDNERLGALAFGAGVRLTLRRSVIEDTRLSAARGATAEGLQVVGGAFARLEESAVLASPSVGVLIGQAGARAELVASLVAGSRSEQTQGDGIGAGILVAAGGSLLLEDSALVRNHAIGLSVSDGAPAEVRRTLVADTQPHPVSDRYGVGVIVERGLEPTAKADVEDATTVIEDSAVVRSRTVGLWVHGATTTAAVRRTVIQATGRQPLDGLLGYGAQVTGGGTLYLSESAVLDSTELALMAAEDGTRLVVDSCLLRAPGQPDAAEGWAGGIQARQGATLDLARTAVADNVGAGIQVAEAGTRAELREVLVLATRHRDEASGRGRGLSVGEGAFARLTDVSLVANQTYGLAIWAEGSAVEAERLLIEGTRPDPDGLWGFGAALLDPCRLSASDSAFRGNHDIGLATFSGAELLLARVLVSETHPSVATGESGVGIAAQVGCDLQLTGSLVQDNALAGVFLYAATATITGTIVERTRAGAFTADDTGLRHEDLADGILAAKGTRLVVQDSRVLDGGRAGLLVDDASGELSGSESRGNSFGLVLQRSPDLVVRDDCRLHGNRTQDLWSDADLALPDEPLPLPDPEMED